MKVVLTDRVIKAAKPATESYDISDIVVPGLIVRVRSSGAKSYALLARYPGSANPTRRSLGRYGRITLRAARDKARKWIAQIARGIDPANAIERERIRNVRTSIVFNASKGDTL